MMKYKLFNNGAGSIIDRRKQVANEKLAITFEGAPEGATAAFKTADGVTYYRAIVDGSCNIPVNEMIGAISVFVISIGSAGLSAGRRESLTRWECEGIVAEILSDGRVLVFPDDYDLPEKFCRMQLEMAEMKKTNEEILGKIQELSKALDDLKEGYNLT